MLQNLSKVRKVSTVLLACCWLVLLGIPVGEMLVWALPGLLVQVEYFRSLPFEPESLDLWLRLAGFAVSMLAQSVLLYGIWRLCALFMAYRQGALFEPDTTGHLRAFSICILIHMLISPFAEGALTALVTSGNAPGERMVAISFASDDLYMILLGGLLLVVAWVLNEGAKAVRENRLIV